MRLHVRLVLFLLLVSGLVLLAGGRLINMQIVNGENWQIQSKNSVIRKVTLPAARGEILDRYGRPLITNRLSYSVSIDRERLAADPERVNVILELVHSAEKTGDSYTDTLPVTISPPFEYTGMTDTQRMHLIRYLEKKKWDAELPAEALMRLLRAEYGISGDISDAEARLAAGVLYEVDLRYVFDQKPYVYIPPYVFASDASIHLVSIISERRLSGVDVQALTVREYQTDAAAHVLGMVGPIYEKDAEYYKSLGYASDEIVGVGGAEKAFESWLHGKAGLRTEEINADGKVQNVVETIAPQAGGNVYLTIDIRFQEAVERLLEAGVQDLRLNGTALKGLEAEAAAAVVLDVKTGEVLALANYPSFSLKTFSRDYEQLLNDPLTPLLNRAIGGVYAPGSTFKMVTATAALESGVITPLTKIYDRGVFTFYASFQPKCHIYPGSHGLIGVSEALQVSCNYFFFDVGQQSKIENIVKWAKLYGLGGPTGIELDSEKTGFIAGPESSLLLHDIWYPGNTLSAAIGQSSNQFTPIQLAGYVACIADGGRLKSSHLLKEVKSYDYTHTYLESQTQIVRTLPIAKENLLAIQKGMHMVAQPGGTAYSLLTGMTVDIAAKTGSVQMGDTPNNGVFVCYAPFDDPQIAVALVVEKGGAGSRVAPIAKDIVEAWFALQEDMKFLPADNVLQR